jgi:hypothetical protein
MDINTLNFVSGRRAERGLTCAARKLAFNEIERGRQISGVCVYG